MPLSTVERCEFCGRIHYAITAADELECQSNRSEYHFEVSLNTPQSLTIEFERREQEELLVAAFSTPVTPENSAVRTWNVPPLTYQRPLPPNPRDRVNYCYDCGREHFDREFQYDEDVDDDVQETCQDAYNRTRSEYQEYDDAVRTLRDQTQNERQRRINIDEDRARQRIVADPVAEEPTRRNAGVFRPPVRCKCEACKMSRFEDSKIGEAVIHEYSFEPEKWNLKKTKKELFPKYYLGVELETDNYYMEARKNSYGEIRRNQRTSNFSYEQAADMRLPRSHWIPKNDSSISGPEFVSHPGTLAYWKSIEPELREMFMTLLHAGYRSHDNDTCGMHVNISKTAFENSAHLYRFMTLLHFDTVWSIRMSQRSRATVSRWAKLSNAKLPKDRMNLCKVATYEDTESGYYGDGHGSAFNIENEGRYEFRLPRGTLRIDRFYKNLEWTHGMIEYSRGHRLLEMRPTKFMEWVKKERKKDYPNLIAFFEEVIDKKIIKRKVTPTRKKVVPQAARWEWRIPEPDPSF